jgi:hypothetical protein
MLKGLLEKQGLASSGNWRLVRGSSAQAGSDVRRSADSKHMVRSFPVTEVACPKYIGVRSEADLPFNRFLNLACG